MLLILNSTTKEGWWQTIMQKNTMTSNSTSIEYSKFFTPQDRHLDWSRQVFAQPHLFSSFLPAKTITNITNKSDTKFSLSFRLIQVCQEHHSHLLALNSFGYHLCTMQQYIKGHMYTLWTWNFTVSSCFKFITPWCLTNIYPYTKGQQKAIQREIERSLNHGRTKLKFITRPWLSIHKRATENYTQMEKCLNQLGMAKQFEWSKALKMSDMVRKSRSKLRKLGTEREREGGGACIDCLLACSGRKKRRFMLASSTVS